MFQLYTKYGMMYCLVVFTTQNRDAEIFFIIILILNCYFKNLKKLLYKHHGKLLKFKIFKIHQSIMITRKFTQKSLQQTYKSAAPNRHL